VVAPGRPATIQVEAPESDAVAPFSDEIEGPAGAGSSIGGWGKEAIATDARTSMATEKVASRVSSRGNRVVPDAPCGVG